MKNEPWIPSQITRSDEFKERALKLAIQYPAAFVMLPVEQGDPVEKGTWARYTFDGVVQLWVDSSHPEALKLYDEVLNEKKERIMTKALTVNEQQTVKTLLASSIQAIKSVLPKHLTPERMLRMAYASITMNPKLAKCSQISLINAIIESSMIGLEIGGPLALAHLVPFNNKRTKTLEATLIIDYKGLIELMYKSPIVKSVTAHPVYRADLFDYEYGLNQMLRHKPETGNRGSLEYAYCIVFFTTGGVDFEVVDEEIAMKAKAKSAAKDSAESPWNKKDEVHNMWVKTAVKRISKRIPKSPELQKAILADSQAEKGEPAFDHVIDVPFSDLGSDDSPEPKDETTRKLDKPPAKKNEKAQTKEEKIIKNLAVTEEMFREETALACKELDVDFKAVVKKLDVETADKITDKINTILDKKAA